MIAYFKLHAHKPGLVGNSSDNLQLFINTALCSLGSAIEHYTTA